MKLLATFPENYELIDAGGGKKLERWGDIITIRPEHQAYFQAALPINDWKKLANWEFIPEKEGALSGQWKALNNSQQSTWEIAIEKAQFQLSLTSNKHIGLFPEQNTNWEFISDFLSPKKRFLNAFAYTGAASVIGRLTGAEVIHCDSSKSIIEWAKTNQALSEVTGIKWVLEDALKFIQREVKRGNKYDLIQLDPPAWGIGSNGEKWKLEEKLAELIQSSYELLHPKGVLIINTYSPKLSLEKFNKTLQLLPKSAHILTCSELWMQTTSEKSLFYGLLARIQKIK
jgi:23S rRNA (cytosine1962-C5)-methyltransferase